MSKDKEQARFTILNTGKKPISCEGSDDKTLLMPGDTMIFVMGKNQRKGTVVVEVLSRPEGEPVSE